MKQDTAQDVTTTPAPDASPAQPSTPAAEISGDQVKNVLKQDLANMVKKVTGGKTLNASERAILTALSQGNALELSAGNSGFVKNQHELAKVLCVTRKSIQRWLKEPGNPGTQADGRYSIIAWQTWANAMGKRCALPDEQLSQTNLKAKQILLQNQKLEFEIAILMDKHVPRDVIKRVWTQLVNAAKTRSFSGVSRLVTLIRLAPDTSAANEIAREEMIDIWREMERAEWYSPQP